MMFYPKNRLANIVKILMSFFVNQLNNDYSE
jgi:hypothetical protein